MLHCPACVNSALPEEYKTTAEAFFPPGGRSAGGLKEAMAFSDILGVGPDFRKLLNCEEIRQAGSSSEEEMKKFLHSFQNNLDLLIQKTWVEKTDEDRKDRLQNRVPGLTALIEKADYAGALREFGEILEELAWLLFGQQSRQDDFIEYALRIDTQMGLFWWYNGQISRVYAGVKDKAVIRSILLLGLCYLADF